MQLTIINRYSKLNISGVYKFYSLDSNSFYIGSSNNIAFRLANHKSQATKNKHFNIHFERFCFYLTNLRFKCNHVVQFMMSG